MEDIISYIILFSIGLTFLLLYQYRRFKPRELPLSEQIFPECDLKVFIIKHNGKIQTIRCRIRAKNNLDLNRASLELIGNNREFHDLPLNKNNTNVALPPTLDINKDHDLNLPFDQFINSIKSSEIKFNTFRFVIESTNGKKFKSHELAFHKNWSIYRPDTGKYN